MFIVIFAVGVKKEIIEKNRRLTNDFAKLFVDLQKEGIFEPSYWRIFSRAIECIAIWAMAYYMFCDPNRGLIKSSLACLLVAVGAGQGGWLMHEGGHHSLTGRPKIDRFLSSLFLGRANVNSIVCKILIFYVKFLFFLRHSSQEFFSDFPLVGGPVDTQSTTQCPNELPMTWI